MAQTSTSDSPRNHPLQMESFPSGRREKATISSKRESIQMNSRNTLKNNTRRFPNGVSLGSADFPYFGFNFHKLSPRIGVGGAPVKPPSCSSHGKRNLIRPDDSLVYPGLSSSRAVRAYPGLSEGVVRDSPRIYLRGYPVRPAHS